MGITMKAHSYDYYAYSNSIARVDKGTKETEIKNQSTNEWVRVKAPEILKRIQEDGTALENRGQADAIYESFKRRLNRPRLSSEKAS